MQKKTLSLRERVKLAFKKYGFTVLGVVAAVVTVIGAIFSITTNNVAKIAKKLGNGLKDVGKKIAAMLPGLIDSIASFVFRAAGEVVSFLGKNAWLLILAVAAFLVNKLTENRHNHRR